MMHIIIRDEHDGRSLELCVPAFIEVACIVTRTAHGGQWKDLWQRAMTIARASGCKVLLDLTCLDVRALPDAFEGAVEIDCWRL